MRAAVGQLAIMLIVIAALALVNWRQTYRCHHAGGVWVNGQCFRAERIDLP